MGSREEISRVTTTAEPPSREQPAMNANGASATLARHGQATPRRATSRHRVTTCAGTKKGQEESQELGWYQRTEPIASQADTIARLCHHRQPRSMLAKKSRRTTGPT